MVTAVVIYGSLVVMVLILASILVAIDRPERFVFVGGIALFIIAHVIEIEPALLGGIVAAIGVILAAGSTIPMLRQPV